MTFVMSGSVAESLPATEGLVRGGAPAGELIHRLSGEGYAVLLLARIDPTGERELHYYGVDHQRDPWAVIVPP
jgi:hypothetical protein